MAVQSTLDIRIRALVQGIEELKALAGGLDQVTTAATSTQGSAEGLDEIGTAATGTSAKVGTLVRDWKSLASSLEALERELSDVARDVKAMGDASEDAATDTNKLAGAAAKTGDAAKNMGDKAQQGAKGVGGLSSGLLGVARNADGTFRALKGVGDGAKVAGDEANKAKKPIEEMAVQVKGLKDGADQLAGYLKSAAVAFAAFLAIKGAKEMADIAARTETLGVTMNVVGRNAGYSATELAKYEAELRKAGITTAVARESITKMIQSGLELNSVNAQGVSRAKELARAAQDLAVVTGENSSDTLQRLITNISQLDTMGLRFQGIIVNTEEAYSKFAATIGKTSDQLTQQQRVTAFANATMAEAAKLTGAYEKSMETVGKKVQSLSRYQEEAANSIGALLLPAYGAIVDAATDLLKTLTAVADQLGRTTDVAGGLQQIVESVLAPMKAVFESVIQTVAELVPTMITVGKTVGELAGELFSVIRAISDFARESGVLEAVLQGMGLAIAGLQDGFKVLATAMSGVGLILLRIGEYAAAATGHVARFFGMDGVAEASFEFSKTLEAQADATQEAIARNVQSFMDGETAVARYTASLKQNAVEAKAATESQKLAYKATDDSITALTGKIRQGQLTSSEAAKEITRLKTEVEGLGKAGDLTKKQVGELGLRLEQLAATDAQKALKAITDLGLATQRIGKFEFLDEMNKAFAQVSASLGELATNVNITDEQFSQAFSKGVDTAKSVADIGVLMNVLRDAQKAGKDTSDEMVLLAQQFRKTFEQELKTARSQEEIELLRKKVIALKTTYPELAKEAQSALDAIDRKTKNSGTSALELSKQQLEVAKQRSSVLTAELGVQQAQFNVNQKLKDVDAARNAYAKEGSKLNKAKLDLAEAELRLAQAQSAAASAKLAVELAGLNAVIAKQKELNTLKAQEQGNASQEQVDAATKVAETTQKTLDIKQQLQMVADGVVQKEQQQVVQLQAGVAEQQRLVDKTKEQADALAGVGTGAGAVAQMFYSLYPTVEGLVGQMKEMGIAASSAGDEADRLLRMFIKERISDINEDWIGIQRINEKMAALRKENDAMKAQAEEMTRSYEAAKDAAEGVYNANNRSNVSIVEQTEGAIALAEAFDDIRRDAEATAKAAVDSAASFVASNRSIREELLQAQGREEEAIKSRMESRRAELKIQYELLKVQLQIAIATAKAGGVDTKELVDALAEANQSYQQAREDLFELEKISLAEREKQRQAAEKKELEDAKKLAEDKKKAKKDAEKEDSNRDTPISETPQSIQDRLTEASALGVNPATLPTAQSIANGAGSGGGAGGNGISAGKRIDVVFKSGQDAVTASVLESDESRLLNVLSTARGLA